MCSRTPPWNSGNKESPDSLRREYLPCPDVVTHWEDPVSCIRLLLCTVVVSEGQIPQIHFPRKNGVKVSSFLLCGVNKCCVCIVELFVPLFTLTTIKLLRKQCSEGETAAPAHHWEGWSLSVRRGITCDHCAAHTEQESLHERRKMDGHHVHPHIPG